MSSAIIRQWWLYLLFIWRGFERGVQRIPKGQSWDYCVSQLQRNFIYISGARLEWVRQSLGRSNGWQINNEACICNSETDLSQNCHHWSAGQAINFAQQDRRKNASKCIIMVILIVARQIPIVLVGLRYRPSFGHGLQLSPVHSTACTEVCGLTKKMLLQRFHCFDTNFSKFASCHICEHH